MKKILPILIALLITASIALNLLIALCIDQYFWTISLVNAIRDKNTVKVEELLRRPNKNVDNEASEFPPMAWHNEFRPQTPLTVAVAEGDYKIVKLLIDNGSNVRKVEELDNSLVNLALLNNNPDNDDGYNLLKILFKNGANPYEDYGYGELPIVDAALDSKRVYKLLKDHVGEDRFFIDRTGVTPLMNAVAGSNFEFVESLVDGGHDINQKDSTGNSALFYALYPGKVDAYMIDLLLNLGADKTITNEEGYRPYDLAVKNWGSNSEVAKLLK